MNTPDNMYAAPKNDPTGFSADEESLIKRPHKWAKTLNTFGTASLAGAVYLFSRPPSSSTIQWYFRLLVFIVGVILVLIACLLKPRYLSREEADKEDEERQASEGVDAREKAANKVLVYGAAVLLCTLAVAMLVLLSMYE